MQNSIAQALFSLWQLTTQAVRNCWDDIRPAQHQCLHTSTLQNKATSLKPKHTSHIHYPYCSTFPPIYAGKTSHFCMTAQTLLGSQLSHRHLWFISGRLLSRSLNSPSTLDSFSLTLTMVKNMQTEAFTGINKFIFLGSQSKCLLVTDKEVCTCVYCWIC